MMPEGPHRGKGDIGEVDDAGDGADVRVVVSREGVAEGEGELAHEFPKRDDPLVAALWRDRIQLLLGRL